jgi:hypothetical protein
MKSVMAHRYLTIREALMLLKWEERAETFDIVK